MPKAVMLSLLPGLAGPAATLWEDEPYAEGPANAAPPGASSQDLALQHLAMSFVLRTGRAAVPRLLLTGTAPLSAERWHAAEGGDAERAHAQTGRREILLGQATAQCRERDMEMPFSPLGARRRSSIQGEYVEKP